MAEHTPGAWVIHDHIVGYPSRRAWIDIEAPDNAGRGGHPICRIFNGFTNQDADARLIAAAPGLLLALEELVEAMVRYETDVDHQAPRNHVAMMTRARAAFFQATGNSLS